MCSHPSAFSVLEAAARWSVEASSARWLCSSPGVDGGGAGSANEHLRSPGHGRVWDPDSTESLDSGELPWGGTRESNLDKRCQEARAEPRGCSPSWQLSGASPAPTETPELQDQPVPGLQTGLWPWIWWGEVRNARPLPPTCTRDTVSIATLQYL